MSGIIFLVQPSPEGGYTARAVDESIFTEADTIPALSDQILDAVRAHFEEGQEPRMIRLYIIPGEHIVT